MSLVMQQSAPPSICAKTQFGFGAGRVETNFVAIATHSDLPWPVASISVSGMATFERMTNIEKEADCTLPATCVCVAPSVISATCIVAPDTFCFSAGKSFANSS